MVVLTVGAAAGGKEVAPERARRMLRTRKGVRGRGGQEERPW